MKQHYQKVTTMPPVSPSMNQKIISWSKIPINIITTQQGSEILSLNIAFTDNNHNTNLKWEGDGFHTVISALFINSKFFVYFWKLIIPNSYVKFWGKKMFLKYTLSLLFIYGYNKYHSNFRKKHFFFDFYRKGFKQKYIQNVKEHLSFCCAAILLVVCTCILYKFCKHFPFVTN